MHSCSRDPRHRASPWSAQFPSGSSGDTLSKGGNRFTLGCGSEATACRDQAGLHRRGPGRSGRGRDWSPLALLQGRRREPLGPGSCRCRDTSVLLHEAQDPTRLPAPPPALTQVSHPLSSSSAPGTTGEVRGGAKLQDSVLLPKGPGHSSRDWGRTQEEASACGFLPEPGRW